MNCDTVDQLLSLQDVDARVEPRLLAEHVGRCERCAREYPEVEWIVSRPTPVSLHEPVRTRVVPPPAAATAALLLVVAWILSTSLAPREPPAPAAASTAIDATRSAPPPPLAAAIPPGRLVVSRSSLSRSRISYGPTKAARGTLTTTTWWPADR